MAMIGGYTNLYPTKYGNVGFWVVTDLHMIVSPQNSTASMTITLSGFLSQADADAGMDPLGTYTFGMTQQQLVAIFGSAQANVQAAILASDAAWAGAVFTAAA